ncbi:helix-turn-helix domain-containing protein [Acetobacteroides hydrogenigenes]|uniref:Helix-turn-helix protein n=1 Tax=Acetobacteroides hydrogenigenes TaxID=979970 RepID=A0A4R2E7J0_9BACT|nr:helix-turn-helix transcriptional regulator [Acetobacteroides hydrogenigenes]TCN64508.1 helix-turn-helix protein [Acetobacteroides hydrogenigenes]
MNDRLDKLLLAEQLTPAKFADIIGVQRSSISHIVSGRNKPSFDFIAKVLQRFPRVNPDWLILGKGEMYKQMVQASLFDVPVVKQLVPEQESNQEIVKQESVADISAAEEVVSKESPTQNTEVESSYPIDIKAFDKEVERIVVFYKDRTFRSYTPSKE